MKKVIKKNNLYFKNKFNYKNIILKKNNLIYKILFLLILFLNNVF